MSRLLLLLLLSGCATEIRRSTCSCEMVQGPDTCSITHEEQAFEKRPLGEKILDAIGSAVGAILP